MANALLWLRQAQDDLKAARASFADGEFALAAQQARNASERSLRAALIALTGRGEEEIHSVAELARLTGFDDVLEEFGEMPRLEGGRPQRTSAYRAIQLAERLLLEIAPKFGK